MTDVALESPLRWLGGLIDIRVEAEADTPGDWVDITEYVERVTTRTGQEKWGSRFTAGSCQLTLDNTAGYFTPPTGASLEDLTWRPGLTIRVRAFPDPEDPDVVFALFTGRVQSSIDSYDAATGDVVARVLLLDVLADLHQFNPPALDTPVPNGQSTSERVHAALNRYGFPPARRRVQGGLHSMAPSALAQSTLEECQRAADAEGGALFADPDNNLVFRQRDWLLGGDDPAMGNYETAVLKAGPLAYWRFTGTGTFDSSGNGHHLVWNNRPALTGQAGVEPDDSAIQLLAANSSAAVTDPTPLMNLTDYTIEFWFKPPTSANTATIIQATGGGGTLYSVQYNPSNGGQVTFGAEFLPLPSIQAMDNLQSAGWVHIAFTVEWAGSTFTVRWYLNGELEGSSVGSGTPPTSAAVSVAGPAGGDSPPIYLSELAVYDRALTATEIEALYEAKDLSFNDRSVNVQAEIGFPDGPPVVDARVSWDVARVRNHITYARTGGTVQVAEDAASQAAYGIRTYQRLDLQNNSNAQVLTLAQRALAAWKDDRIRVDQVTVAARADDPDLHKLFYDAQLGDLVSVRINPRPGFTYDTEAHIIGIAHSITPSDWTVTLILDDSQAAQEV